MNYQFPEIRTLADVLPPIEGRSEFIIAERPYGKIINYVVAMADTFNMTGADDLGGAIRRELRGLKFHPDGTIAARTFHKFFNIGEKEETQPHLIDFSRDHTIMEKRDGSMLHPMQVDGHIRWMTKMGITSVAEQAEEFISANVKYLDFASWCIENELTPIFEWTSPNNKIVIEYPEDSLTLLAVRHTITGEYMKTSDSVLLQKIQEFNIPVVEVHSSFESAKALLEYTKPLRGVEGFVVDFDGHKVKVKADHYVMLHKTKDMIRSERNIADIIINEQLDDVLPLLDATDLATVRAYELHLDAAIENVLGRLEGLITLARVLHGGVKKDVAINFVPNLLNKEDASFIFAAIDGKDLRSLVIKKIKDSVGNTTKYENLMAWMQA